MANKLEVAAEQLEAAIELFASGRFAAAATLAGAAEEILGRKVQALGGVSDLDSMATGVTRIHELLTGEAMPKKTAKQIINRTKNALKHMDGSDDETVEGDIRDEAMVLLWRAIHNYDRLDLPFNSTIAGFPGNARDA